MLALILAVSLGQSSMQVDMKTYFEGETAEAWAFTGLGAVSLGSGAVLLSRGERGSIGASIPLFAVGLIQLVLGIGLWMRTPPQVAALESQLTKNPGEYVKAERTRMERVMRGFGLYKAVEVGLFFGGVGLAGVGGVVKSDFALGSGFSLALEALAMLILDFFAEARGRAYESALVGFKF
jgi:hypothetical protein